MSASFSSGCSDRDRERADRYAIEAFNYGYKIGFGMPVDPGELGELQRKYNQLPPECQQYVQVVGQRLQGMLQAGQIRDFIDRIPL